jgi:hypothetical protein
MVFIEMILRFRNCGHCAPLRFENIAPDQYLTQSAELLKGFIDVKQINAESEVKREPEPKAPLSRQAM